MPYTKGKVYVNQNKHVLIGIICDLLKTSHSISTSHSRTRPFFLMTRTPSTTKYYKVLHPYYKVLYSTPYYKVLYNTTLYYEVLYSTTLYYKVLHSTTPQHKVLYSTTPYYKVLQSTTPYHKVQHNPLRTTK